jgi:aminomethyltransferase
MSTEAELRTPLYDWHVAHGGRIVEFGGWLMPVQYSSIIEEHLTVRNRVGLFDISHMGRLRFEGAEALAWLELATTNHVAKLEVGQIQYSLMVDADGGVLDDVLVYRLPNAFFIVCNASNRLKVLAQLERLREGLADARVRDLTTGTVMVAVQGPRACATIQKVVDGAFDDLKYFRAADGRYADQNVLVSRTGYTGEDGFEVVLDAELGERLWTSLLAAGHNDEIRPCGLGARDTLRFEAAMPLYGHEMDETVNPYAAGLGWAVKLNKGEFVGRNALSKFKSHPGRTRVGLALEGKRIARQGCPVKQGDRAVGAVTSGTFSPTLNRSLAMALVEPACAADGTPVLVDVRGKDEAASVVPLPFYHRK